MQAKLGPHQAGRGSQHLRQGQGVPSFTGTIMATNRCRLIMHRPDRSIAAAQQDVENKPQAFAAARKTISKALEAAVKREDYNTAAKLKRELEDINQQDPLYQLAQEFEASVREQRFQDAARLKAQISELEASMGPTAPEFDVTLRTGSETVTAGVRVKIQSTYRPAESSPQHGQYFFSYQVVITNESDEVVQLRHRHWVIRDANGKVEEVRGPGVVGVQPILLPGKSFEYDSACPLRTPMGTMEGEYEMMRWSEVDGQFMSAFEVNVGRFKLSKE